MAPNKDLNKKGCERAIKRAERSPVHFPHRIFPIKKITITVKPPRAGGKKGAILLINSKVGWPKLASQITPAIRKLYNGAKWI